MHRAMSAFATAALMAVALSACGSDESKGGDFDHSSSSTSTSTSTSEQPTEAPTTTTTTTITTTKAPGSSGKPSSSSDLSAPSSASQDTSNGEDGGATAIKNVWVDDSWTVEEKSDDVCAQGGLYTSQYSTRDDVFTCGPIAASALACMDEGGGKTTYITNVLGRKAMTFSSSVVEDVQSSEGESMPLYVELENGAKCATISHDHDQHWDGKRS